MGSEANDLDTAGLLEQPLSADAAASPPPPDRLLGPEPSEDNEEAAPHAGRADAGQTPTRAAGPDAGPDADASLMGERGLEASSPLDVLSSGVQAGTMPSRSPPPSPTSRLSEALSSLRGTDERVGVEPASDAFVREVPVSTSAADIAAEDAAWRDAPVGVLSRVERDFINAAWSARRGAPHWHAIVWPERSGGLDEEAGGAPGGRLGNGPRCSAVGSVRAGRVGSGGRCGEGEGEGVRRARSRGGVSGRVCSVHVPASRGLRSPPVWPRGRLARRAGVVPPSDRVR